MSAGGAYAVIWILYAAATLFTGLRLEVQWRHHRKFGISDYWMFCAFIFMLPLTILLHVNYHRFRNLEVHDKHNDWNGDDEFWQSHVTAHRWARAIFAMLWTVIWSVKAAFLCLYYPLLSPGPWGRRLWYCATTCVFATYIACWICLALEERGVAKLPILSVFYTATFDIVTDVMLMGLPMIILPSLRVNRSGKIGLAIVFSLGIFIIAAAILRMTVAVVPFPSDHLSEPPEYKYTLDADGVIIWTAVEASISVIVGSLPPLKATFTKRIREQYNNRKAYFQYHGKGGFRSLRSHSKPRSQQSLVVDGGPTLMNTEGMSQERTVMNSRITMSFDEAGINDRTWYRA